jgi:hypothetical protein
MACVSCVSARQRGSARGAHRLQHAVLGAHLALGGGRRRRWRGLRRRKEEKNANARATRRRAKAGTTPFARGHGSHEGTGRTRARRVFEQPVAGTRSVAPQESPRIKSGSRRPSSQTTGTDQVRWKRPAFEPERRFRAEGRVPEARFGAVVRDSGGSWRRSQETRIGPGSAVGQGRPWRQGRPRGPLFKYLPVAARPAWPEEANWINSRRQVGQRPTESRANGETRARRSDWPAKSTILAAGGIRA